MALPSDYESDYDSVASENQPLKHSFAFVSHFIAEEGYSILTETFLQKSSLVSDNNFIS